MLSCPETTRILRQFEEQYLPDREGNDHLNHEMGASAQNTFKKQVNHSAIVIRRMRNPFLDDFPELITWIAETASDDSVAESVFNLQELGKTQYQQYPEGRYPRQVHLHRQHYQKEQTSPLQQTTHDH